MAGGAWDTEAGRRAGELGAQALEAMDRIINPPMADLEETVRAAAHEGRQALGHPMYRCEGCGDYLPGAVGVTGTHGRPKFDGPNYVGLEPCGPVTLDDSSRPVENPVKTVENRRQLP